MSEVFIVIPHNHFAHRDDGDGDDGTLKAPSDAQAPASDSSGKCLTCRFLGSVTDLLDLSL